MKLHKEIKKRLSNRSIEEVIEAMGYDSQKVGQKTLNAFLNTKNVYEWLKGSHYDLVHSSESFIRTLARMLDVTDKLIEKEIRKAKKRYAVYVELKTPVIRAETEKKSISLIQYMMGRGRNTIDIPKERFVFKTDEEIFKEVGEMIREHFQKYKGVLPVFGKITHYVYEHVDGKAYKFTTEGDKVLDSISRERDKYVV